MSLNDVALATDLAAIFADFTQTLTYDGTSYRCAAGESNESRQARAAGMASTGTLEFTVIDADFPSSTPPLEGEKITHNGATYRVESPTRLAGDVSTTFTGIKVV